MTDFITQYHQLVASGQARPDPAQAVVAAALQNLAQDLADYKAPPAWQFWKKPNVCHRGIYIYGGVGRGKSWLMDLFYNAAPVARKRRVHFHPFMLELHAYLHQRRQVTRGEAVDNALADFAAKLAREASLLCFDEFHVVDIADAMLLRRLFDALWQNNVVIVATSNWAPDELYKDGLQRDRFLPFIAELKRRMQVLHLASPTDYRLARLNSLPVYYAPLGHYAQQQMITLFNNLTQDATITPLSLNLGGRYWIIPRAAKGIVWLDFADACAAARGAPDYLALAKMAQVVFLANVPRLSDELRNEVKRLMTLIDALYEAKVKLVMSADAPTLRLYADGRQAFEFERTVSRLLEMQSASYLGNFGES